MLMVKQKGNKNWSKKEQEILDEHLGFKPPSEIVKILARHGFHRTEEAIKNRCTSSNISFACHYDNLSLRKIAELLKVSPCTTHNWYHSGQLPGKKRNRYQVMVRYDDVRNFLKSRKFRTEFDPDGLNFFLGDK
jgi:hypothetical protein